MEDVIYIILNLGKWFFSCILVYLDLLRKFEPSSSLLVFSFWFLTFYFSLFVFDPCFWKLKKNESLYYLKIYCTFLRVMTTKSQYLPCEVTTIQGLFLSQFFWLRNFILPTVRVELMIVMDILLSDLF